MGAVSRIITDLNKSGEGTKARQPSVPEVLDSHCLIEPGEYEVTFLFLRTSTAFNRHSISLWFSIATFGPVFGLYLPRHYNMEWVKKGGSFKARRHSDCVREFIAVTGGPVKRTDRIPLQDRYKGRVILAKVRTVKMDSKGQPLPELARYSVIEKLIRSNTQ
jgi:hypothetical protein